MPKREKTIRRNALVQADREDRQFRRAVQLKNPARNWLTSMAQKRRVTMTQLVEELFEAQIN
jgi:predicted DNA-binding ribbon-helix-helix protein